MAEHIDAVIVGGGQAGLATSHELTRAGIEHVVLERSSVGQAWRDRWDTFCLVTPNWSVQLPGGPYDGDDPDGFMPRDEIVSYLQRYAEGLGVPVREGVEVVSLDPAPGGRFLLATSGGDIVARSVVIATGAYQRPHRPAGAAGLPDDLLAIDVGDYRNAGALPAGSVLVIGSGQSGCQIAEELLEAGREVFLACGRAPWAPRRIGDWDAMWWLVETGFLDQPASMLATPEARLAGNVQVTGHGGGRDLNYRTLRTAGVTLLGRFLGAEGRRAGFAADLGDSVAWADERSTQMFGLFRTWAAGRGLPVPDIAEPAVFDGGAPETLDLSGFGAVVFAGGFRPDYGRWVKVPEAFDPMSFPIQTDGACTTVPGLYFVGVHFLRKRKSSLLVGVGEDAAVVAPQIAAQLGG